MDPIAELRAATKISIRDLRWHYSASLEDLGLGSGDGETWVDLDKPAGMLAFTLNTSALSLVGLDTNFDILFTGAAQSDGKTVIWTPSLTNPTVHVQVETPLGTKDAKVTGVSGSLSTVVTQVDNSGALLPSGDMLASVDVNSSGTNDALHVTADVELSPGVTPTAKINLTQVQVIATAGISSKIWLVMEPELLAPPLYAFVVGSKHWCTASLGGAVPADATIKYEWTIGSIAQPDANGTGKPTCTFTLTDRGNLTVSVKVTMTEVDQTAVFTGSRTYPVITRQEAMWIYALLRIRRMDYAPLGPLYRLIGPDPGPEAVKTLLSRSFLEEAQSFGKYLALASGKLLGA